MDILDRLLEHNTEATRRLLALCRELPDEHLQKAFEFGQKSLYSTLDHLIDSEEYWTSLMLNRPGPFTPAPLDPARSVESLMRRYEAISPVFMTLSRQCRDEDRLDELFVDIETGPARRSFGACIVHVATHGMHHRAQIRVTFDLLGIEYDPFGGDPMDRHPLND